MNIERIKAEVEQYLKQPCVAHETIAPMLVSSPNVDCFSDIRTYFMMPESRVFHVSSCAHWGGCPALYDIDHALHQRTQATILDQWTLFLKLAGDAETEHNIVHLLNDRFKFPLLILCLQMNEIADRIRERDPRLTDQIVTADGKTDNLPILAFIKPQVHTGYAQKLVEREVFASNMHDITSLADDLENRHSSRGLSSMPLLQRNIKNLVETDWQASMFPNRALEIEMIDTPFSILKQFDRAFLQYEPTDGTDEQWSWLLESVAQTDRLEASVSHLLGISCNDLDHLDKYSDWSPNQRWLYVLVRKNKVTDNVYLNEVMRNTASANQFVRQLYRTIANHRFSEKDFGTFYRERRELLRQLQDNSGEAENFCSWIAHKEQTAIYYLTNLTRIEQEMILRLTATYADGNNVNNYIRIFKSIYPDVADYLENDTLPISEIVVPDASESKELSRYFNDYRLQKTINNVLPDFVERVNNEAKKRSFYRFSPRNTFLNKVFKTLSSIPTQVWFVDAMGVEFVPYIQRVCNKMGLCCNTQICRANLPTITKFNNEFVDEFKKKGVKIHNIKDVDELKHHSIQDTGYKKADISIHLIDELECIKRVLKHIKQKLQTFETKRAILLSDHGASRLAVLTTGQPIYEVDSDVEESGRVCANCEIASSVSAAVCAEADGVSQYVLADYGRFRGSNISRKAQVEVHGGATLEEVLVPFCEITLPQNNTNYEITITTPEIKVGPRQCAIIKLFSRIPVSSMSIKFKDKRYHGRILDGQTEDGKMFMYICDFIKTAGVYTFDVYIDGECIKQDESFKTISIGMQTNDDFF